MAKTIHKWEIALLLFLTGAIAVALANYLPESLYVDLFLVFAVYIGWHLSPGRAAVVGTLFGLAEDIVIGGFLGLNGFSKTLAAFTASHLNRWFTLEGFLSRVFLLALLTAADGLVIYVMLMFLGQPLQGSFWLNVLIRIVVTGTLGGLIFQVYDRIKFPRKDFRRLEI